MKMSTPMRWLLIGVTLPFDLLVQVLIEPNYANWWGLKKLPQETPPTEGSIEFDYRDAPSKDRS